MPVGKPPIITMGGVRGAGGSRRPAKQWDPRKAIRIRMVLLIVALLLVLLNGTFQRTGVRMLPRLPGRLRRGPLRHDPEWPWTKVRGSPEPPGPFRDRAVGRPSEGVMEERAVSVALKLLAVLGLVLANGFFVVAELSLVAVRRSRVEQLVAEDRAQPG